MSIAKIDTKAIYAGYIEAVLLTNGRIQTKDVQDAFALNRNTASTVLNEYARKFPDQVRMDRTGFVCSETITPILLRGMKPEEYLRFLDHIPKMSAKLTGEAA